MAAASEMEKKCDQCRFWDNSHSIDPQKYGTCRRYPPSGNEDQIQPSTNADDWCGEHQPIDS